MKLLVNKDGNIQVRFNSVKDFGIGKFYLEQNLGLKVIPVSSSDSKDKLLYNLVNMHKDK